MISIKNNHWLLGLLASICIFTLSFTSPMKNAEHLIYDWSMQQSSKVASQKISIIAIDDLSISNLGRWPWSRDMHASMIDMLTEADAKVIASSIFFLEPQKDKGLDYIEEIINELKVPENNLFAKKILSKLSDAKSALDVDTQLASSIEKSNKTLLPLFIVPGKALGKADEESNTLDKISLNNIEDKINAIENGLLPLTSTDIYLPIQAFSKASIGLGHLNVIQDNDGAVRKETLVFDHYNQFIPSLSIAIVAKSLNLSSDNIEILLGEGIRLGRLFIKTNSQLQMNTHYYQNTDRQSFSVDSFYDVISGKIPLNKYKDKIVLIGATATGVGDVIVTPVSAATTPVESLAHTVSSLLQEDFYTSPNWAIWATLAAYFLAALYLMFVAPKLHVKISIASTASLALTLLLLELLLMTQQSIWIPLFGPIVLLLIGHGVVSSYSYLTAEKNNELVSAESAESNKMLGLSFQSQGQLDMAFEKFRRCPTDKSILEILYNLALDFERKRQFNKAVSVYQHIADADSSFKDIKKRMAFADSADKNVMLSTHAQSSGPGASLITQDGIEKPMLGRYQVESELGKGAMGIVYLGKDPKIGRTVAIKTMALAQEFEGEELVTAKERFFREAESAGRLSHPNIVTIFDAGEEQDLAFIAMEFLKGKELTVHTKATDLLEGPVVLELCAKIADALSYAHSMNVVHRDIKPANILYDEETESPKITDFGIARITDSSKTKTGTVLGTPTYMAPEQFSGQKVDGRADLFSLGVMLFQMITGELPFKGDSMANLMYCIANNDPPSAESLCPGLPSCVTETINKALMKKADDRFANGREMAVALRDCLSAIE